MSAHNKKQTDKIELVETNNIALSLRRLREIPNTYSDHPARRALYHALCMCNIFAHTERAKIREAIGLP